MYTQESYFEIKIYKVNRVLCELRDLPLWCGDSILKVNNYLLNNPVRLPAF